MLHQIIVPIYVEYSARYLLIKTVKNLYSFPSPATWLARGIHAQGIVLTSKYPAKVPHGWTRWLKRNTGNEYLIQAWPRHKSGKVRCKLPLVTVMVFMDHSRDCPWREVASGNCARQRTYSGKPSMAVAIADWNSAMNGTGVYWGVMRRENSKSKSTSENNVRYCFELPSALRSPVQPRGDFNARASGIARCGSRYGNVSR